MNLKKHLDRAEQALERGQADFAVELCDQVLDFAPGEQRAAELLVAAAVAMEGKSGLLKKLGSAPGGLAAKFSKLTRNAEGEARQLRRAFIKDPANTATGLKWGDALERAGYAGAALGVFGGLAARDGAAAKRAGALAAAQGEVDAALDYYQQALDVNPRDTDAMRARKNLAAEQALRSNQYDDGSGLDSEAFLRAARGEDVGGDEEPKEE